MRRVQKAAAVLAALALTTALAVPVWADDTTGKLSSVSDKQEIDVKGEYNRTRVYRVDIAWDDMTNFKYEAGTWNAENYNENGSDFLQYTEAKGWNNTVEETNNKKASHNIKVTNYSNANIAMEFTYKNENTVYDNQVKTYPAGTSQALGNAVERKLMGGFFSKNDAETIAPGDSYNIVSKIWLQRADAIVRGTSVKSGTKIDDAGYNAKGTAVTGNIGFMMAGRPINDLSKDNKIGTITITISDAGDGTDLTVPTAGTDYGVVYTHTADTDFESYSANAGN